MLKDNFGTVVNLGYYEEFFSTFTPNIYHKIPRDTLGITNNKRVHSFDGSFLEASSHTGEKLDK